MIPSSSTSVVPPEIYQNIETLHEQVEALRRELNQAQEVWKTTLADEKSQFDELLARKELASQEQDGQWARQSQAYEDRLAELKSEFEARLAQTEQNAARSLSELDDAWQRDKLDWGPTAKDAWPDQRRQLEAKVQALELEVEQLRSERRPQNSAGPTPETVKALQAQLLDFQSAVSTLEDRASRSDDLVNACVQALDYQISVLYDLVQHFSAPQPNENLDVVQS